MTHTAHDSDAVLTTHLNDLRDTEALARTLANNLHGIGTVYLQGNLGAGKTTLVRALLQVLGWSGNVKSPTYTLIEPYVVSKMHVYHFDFYRFNVPEEFLEAGLEEYFDGSGLCLIEWPDKAQPYLPQADLETHLNLLDGVRQAKVTGLSVAGKQCVNRLKDTWQTS